MSFVDLHCHWVHEIDDGARSVEESRAMLQGLSKIGFAHVVATPHMRPGMFDNTASTIKKAYRATCARMHHDPAWPTTGQSDQRLPRVSLGSEHFFDGEVLTRVRLGQGLPYREASPHADPTDDEGAVRNGGALLLEFADLTPLSIVHRQLFELQTQGYIVVLAHPERYRATWGKPEVVEDLIDRGVVTLLDAAAVVGKYGGRARSSALDLLDQGLYHAACSDAHRPNDVELVERGMAFIANRYGDAELELLFGDGPRAILSGQKPPL